MRALYLASVWLHVLAAAAWIGGMVFLVAVLVPVLRGRPFGDVQTELLYRVGLRLRHFGWAMMGLLVATGVANVALLGGRWGDAWSGALWHGAWGRALLAKLVMVGATLGLSAAHDFWVGPRAVALTRAEPGSARSRRYTRWARGMGRLMLVLSLGVLALAVMLPRGGL
jgi:putative copper export protein